ncbi:MAG: hypothetical protein ABIQ06_15280 [Caldimonas sp.]
MATHLPAAARFARATLGLRASITRCHGRLAGGLIAALAVSACGPGYDAGICGSECATQYVQAHTSIEVAPNEAFWQPGDTLGPSINFPTRATRSPFIVGDASTGRLHVAWTGFFLSTNPDSSPDLQKADVLVGHWIFPEGMT